VIRLIEIINQVVKYDKRERILLIIILLVAACLRLWGIWRLGFFTYDQARDALYIKRILVEHKLRLIGTQSSIPGLFTGPAYYYLMAPFLWFFKLNPVGIDIGTAIIGIVTVGLVYFLVKTFTRDQFSALVIAFLYSLQPQIVSQSRFAWNPNTMPFFCLLFIGGLFWVGNKDSLGWLLVLPVLAILCQLHYSAVCLMPVLILFILIFRKKIKPDKWLVVSFLLFLLIMLPLLFFELRHEFINTKAVLGYLKGGAIGEIPPPPFLPGLWEKLRFLLVEMVFGIKDGLASLLLMLIIFGLSVLIYLRRKVFRLPLFLILSWLIFGVFVASLYQGSFFNFYLTFLYPAGFLLIGILISFLSRKSRLAKIGIFLLTMMVAILNLAKLDVFSEPERTIDHLRMVARVMAEDIEDDQPFNLVGALGEGRFDYNAVDYRYFLETFYAKKALDWDVLDYQSAKRLYLISEIGEITPLETNIWEVSLFNPQKVLKVWKLPRDVLIYKLSK
jgi:4-amino-4-deoxy-L-arabinose transferase-like glycosyltransferase